MQRKEIIKEIATKTGLEKGTVNTTIETFMVLVEEHLLKGEHISMSGFGRFGIKKRAAKMGRNISNNTPIKIPAYSAAVFKPSRSFVKMVSKRS